MLRTYTLLNEKGLTFFGLVMVGFVQVVTLVVRWEAGSCGGNSDLCCDFGFGAIENTLSLPLGLSVFVLHWY